MGDFRRCVDNDRKIMYNLIILENPEKYVNKLLTLKFVKPNPVLKRNT